jgi:hypothetical protein
VRKALRRHSVLANPTRRVARVGRRARQAQRGARRCGPGYRGGGGVDESAQNPIESICL